PKVLMYSATKVILDASISGVRGSVYLPRRACSSTPGISSLGKRVYSTNHNHATMANFLL
ncbi:hypothetical protein COCVIDRAFT_99300, partial [Bipolaris victoriae FI3]